MRKSLTIFGLLALLTALVACGGGPEEREGFVTSADGLRIHYAVHGQGPAVVLIHCWSCDASYWDTVVPDLAEDHTVVTLDLAGHGQSESGRENYTMEAFGQDVVAVMRALDLENAVVVGHSMGGDVAVETADQVPDRVAGVIGVDTLHEVDVPFTEDQKEQYMLPMREDFAGFVPGMVAPMFPAGFDTVVRDSIAADMAAAPPDVALSAFDNLWSYDLDAAARKLKAPLRLILDDTYPAHPEQWRERGVDVDVRVIPGAGHFPMMTQPEEFLRLLREAIRELQG